MPLPKKPVSFAYGSDKKEIKVALGCEISTYKNDEYTINSSTSEVRNLPSCVGNDVLVSGDGNTAVWMSSEDHTLQMFDLNAWEETKTVPILEKPRELVSIDDMGNKISLIDERNNIVVIDLVNPQSILTWPIQGAIKAIDFGKQSDNLLLVHESSVAVISISAQREIFAYPATADSGVFDDIDETIQLMSLDGTVVKLDWQASVITKKICDRLPMISFSLENSLKGARGKYNHQVSSGCSAD